MGGSLRRIGVVTLFPEAFTSYLGASILGRAIGSGLLELHFEQIRDHAHDKHRRVDDAPYGGGVGQVMMVSPIVEALRAVQERALTGAHVVLLGPGGARFDQSRAVKFAQMPQDLVLICGHYEGVDERVRAYVDEELSVGDYVLTGGELAAMVVIDAVSRFVPGVLGNENSPLDESFSADLLEYPQYTRPWSFEGLTPPEVLRSGNHGAIASWRQNAALERTKEQRPDLVYNKVESTPE